MKTRPTLTLRPCETSLGSTGRKRIHYPPPKIHMILPTDEWTTVPDESYWRRCLLHGDCEEKPNSKPSSKKVASPAGKE